MTNKCREVWYFLSLTRTVCSMNHILANYVCFSCTALAFVSEAVGCYLSMSSVAKTAWYQPFSCCNELLYAAFNVLLESRSAH